MEVLVAVDTSIRHRKVLQLGQGLLRNDPGLDSGILKLEERLAMPDHTAHKVGDLAHEERLLVERWLGRPLSNDETISLTAYRPHPAPNDDERDILRQEIVAQAQEIGSRAGKADEKEVEAIIDEAFTAIRGRPS